MGNREQKPSEDVRRAELERRKRLGFPWHGPPHLIRAGYHRFLITAACHKHQPFLGTPTARLTELMESWLRMAGDLAESQAFCFLPNHYHVLVVAEDVLALLKEIGRLHGRTSHAWNGADGLRGRQIFHRAAETRIKNERHYLAARNYVHHNPVRHGYVDRWTEWPWSSAIDFLQRTDPDEAKRLWRDYDISTFGDGWDDPEL